LITPSIPSSPDAFVTRAASSLEPPYAIATGRAKYNPLNDLRGALKSPVRKHQAYLKENELPAYLKKLEAYDNPQTKLALKFLLLTFVRTTELRGAKWTEINFEKNEWRIPVERMKMKALHIVPLSRQAVAVLKEMKAFSGQWEFVFPNQHKPSGCMSESVAKTSRNFGRSWIC
jgi:integrase